MLWLPLTPSLLRLFAFVGVLSLMFSLESIWPKREWKTPRWKRLSVHSVLSVLNTLLLRFTIATPLLLLTDLLEKRQWGLSHALGLNGWGEIVVTLILFDFFDYWWHRFNHTAPLLWRFHRVHHMDTHVDVTTALRFHAGELLISGVVKMFWVLFWGPSIWGFAIFEAGITGFSEFHHSNIDFPDEVEKVVRAVHMTPRVHASHHTVSLRTRNANYSTIFSVWDRLFHSFQEPNPQEMETIGLEEGRDNYLSFRKVLLAPFVNRAL
ncbi:MAG: sterol desaturase family protein [Elusimicrobia bacterium]|nr:sterol desaturase family protein [Elusimicrobiota bacterium]